MDFSSKTLRGLALDPPKCRKCKKRTSTLTNKCKGQSDSYYCSKCHTKKCKYCSLKTSFRDTVYKNYTAIEKIKKPNSTDIYIKFKMIQYYKVIEECANFALDKTHDHPYVFSRFDSNEIDTVFVYYITINTFCTYDRRCDTINYYNWRKHRILCSLIKFFMLCTHSHVFTNSKAIANFYDEYKRFISSDYNIMYEMHLYVIMHTNNYTTPFYITPSTFSEPIRWIYHILRNWNTVSPYSDSNFIYQSPDFLGMSIPEMKLR